MAERIDHKDFRSYEYGSRRNRKYTMRYFSRPERRYRRAAEMYEDYSAGGSMLVKMGICLLLCGLALVAKTVYSGENLAQTAANLTEKAENIGGEYLGKLRFVELPGIMQVFSRDSRLSLNISGATYQSSDDGMLLTVSNTADKTVQSPGNGKIKNVSTDANGKGAVELWTDGDIMISVDGFSELWVEEGQPVSRGDTLGSGSDSLSIRVYKGGRPMEAEKLFDVDANIPA